MADEPAQSLSWWRRLLGGAGLSERTRGYPTSSNRAASMHLFWDLPGRFVEVSVTVTIIDEPQSDDLYFWALQVGFEDRATGRREGAAHTGPQWAAQHPGHGAVNWGGYGARDELDGGPGWLPSTSGNANSVDYPWRVGVSYRLTIARAPTDGAAAPPGFTAWRATITPLTGAVSAEAGQTKVQQSQVIRDLWAPGDLLVSPMVWSEVFARCDAASVRVTWSDPTAIDERGAQHRVGSARVNYQTVTEGGCSNTDVAAVATPDGPAWLQTTSTERVTPSGSSLRFTDPR